MEFMNIGDKINYEDYNALVYLLRKFKKLTTHLRMGSNDLTSEYGNFHFSDGFENIGNNFILNSDVTITSDDVLQNAFYTFVFTVLDVNLSGEVNKRFIEVSGGTSESSELNIVLPKDSINDNEVLVPDFKVEVTFDLHEYYTPKQSLNFDVSADKLIHSVDDPATITVKVQNALGIVKGVNVTFNDGLKKITFVSDDNGEVSYTLGQIRDWGEFSVYVTVENVTKTIDLVKTDYIIKATFVGGDIDFYLNFPRAPGGSGEQIAIDWGDDDYPEVIYTSSVRPLHKYDNYGSHEILIGVNVFEFYVGCFQSEYLEEIIIPEGFKTINMACFESPILKYISLPSTIIYISQGIVGELDIIDLNWIIVPNNCRNKEYGDENTTILIPHGTTSEYINAGFLPSCLVEKDE